MVATSPGPSRLQRRAGIEDRAHVFHQALKDRGTLPEIADALERELAPVLGEAVSYERTFGAEHRRRNGFSIHRQALDGIHETLENQQRLRNALGLPHTANCRDLDKALESLSPETRRGLYAAVDTAAKLALG